ncbi:MAG: DNA-binding protein WhiA [Clostridia bacterium]|nr:DNA-binding protein WhiA [Clostridia bacterium]
MRASDTRSFSAGVKEELNRLPLGKACCMLSEISALTQTSGHLAFRGGGWISVSYRLDNAGTARRLFQLLKKRLNAAPKLHFVQTRQLGGRRSCVLTLGTEDTRALLNALHMTETDEDGQMHLKRTVPRHPMTRQCCRRAFLRGAFLGAGTLTNPEKSYHFEWKAEDDRLAETLEKLLEKCELPYQSYIRKGQQVIYLKGAQQISDILAIMGAGSSVLEMENIRINKQLRAAATRASNCDEHNSEKMLDAGQKQAEAIRKISLSTGLFTLPPALREVARLRVENPDLSLKELGEMMDPPVGKSGVNHRLRRLMEIAEQIEQEYGEGEKDR